MIKENGLTLQDLINLADEVKMNYNEIYLLSADSYALTEIDFSDECPELWFLGDNDNEEA